VTVSSKRPRRQPVLAINKAEHQVACPFPEWNENHEHHKYKQCVLRRGSVEQTSWIPEKFAVIGKTLKLKIGDEWDDGWVVKFVSEREFPTEAEPGEIGIYWSVVE